MKKKLLVLPLFLLVFIIPITVLANTYINWVPKTSLVDHDKVWTIQLSTPIDPNSANSENIYVENSLGKKVPIVLSMSENNDKVIITPPISGYSYDQSYTLYIEKSIKTTNHNLMKQSIKMPFKIKSKPDPKTLLLGTWNTTYNGYKIKATFNSNYTCDTELLGMKLTGKYTLEGNEMNMSIATKELIGELQFINDNKFTVTSESGSVATFTRVD